MPNAGHIESFFNRKAYSVPEARQIRAPHLKRQSAVKEIRIPQEDVRKMFLKSLLRNQG